MNLITRIETDIEYALCAIYLKEHRYTVVEIRFEYEHAISKQRVKGRRLRWKKVDKALATCTKLELDQGERVVCIRRWLGDYGTLHAIEITTNYGRAITSGKRVGKANVETIADGWLFRSMEKLTASGNASKSRVVGCPTFSEYKPSNDQLERLDLDVAAAITDAYAVAFHEVSSFAERGFADMSSLIAVLQSLSEQASGQLDPGFRNGLWGVLLPRRLRISELKRIFRDIQVVLAVLPAFHKVEQTHVLSDPTTVKRFVQQDVTTSNFQTFTKLHDQDPQRLLELGAVDRLMVFLIANKCVNTLAHVAHVHANAQNQTLPEAMAVVSQRIPLVRLAIKVECDHILTWLADAAQLELLAPPFVPLTRDSHLDEMAAAASTLDLAHGVQDASAKERILFLLGRAHSRLAFVRRVAEIKERRGLPPASSDELHELVRHLPSVFCLPLVFNLGKHLDGPDRASLARAAFAHAASYDNELVLEEADAVFYAIFVNKAVETGLLSEVDRETFVLRRNRANLPSAPCMIKLRNVVLPLQREIKVMQAHLSTVIRDVHDLGRTVEHNLHVALHREHRARVVEGLSTLLIGLGGPAFRFLANVLDLSQAIHLLTTLIDVNAEDLGKFLANTTAEFVYQHGVESALRCMEIEPVPFVRHIQRLALADRQETASRVQHPAFNVDAVTTALAHAVLPQAAAEPTGEQREPRMMLVAAALMKKLRRAKANKLLLAEAGRRRQQQRDVAWPCSAKKLLSTMAVVVVLAAMVAWILVAKHDG